MKLYQLNRYLSNRTKTAAHEALVLCKKFYPWRVEQAEAMREEVLVKKAQAGR